MNTMNKEEYDFNLYHNLEDMVGYNGFITPEGNFYRVRAFTEESVGLVKHEDWAGEWLRTKGIKFKAKNKREYNIMAYMELIHNHHFFAYSENSIQAEIGYAFLFTERESLTEKQQKLIDELNELNFNKKEEGRHL